MTYTYTHALILIYSKHITVTDIRIFHKLYNKLIHILVLIADLYLFRSLVRVTELILVQISRRSYRAYTYTEVPVGTIELILVQRYP